MIDRLIERPIERLGTTTSTQEIAKTRADEGKAHGYVVVADVQTGGRGRRGRAWSSSGPHGLWMSMVLRTSLPMAKAPRLALCAADVIAGVVVEFGGGGVNGGVNSGVFVKWPNDLMVASTTEHPVLGPFRKCGGLLVEAVDVKGPLLRTAILGLGLNLRVPNDAEGGGFPDDVADVAAAAFVGDVDKDALLNRLQRELMSIEDACLDDAAFAEVRDRLSLRSATLRRRVSVDDVHGTAVAIACDGALVIESDDGRRHSVHAGDVHIKGHITGHVGLG